MNEVEVARELIKESFWYSPYNDTWTIKRHYSVITEKPAFQSSNKQVKKNE